MDQIQSIRVFARVVEAGTFTKAAESLNLPKGTVTKLVQHLEARLKVKLLNRTTRRVTVTPDGAAYYERTVRVLNDLDDIEASMTNAQASPSGRLRVDVGSSVAREIIIPALADFFRRFPDIQLDLGVSDRSVDLLADNVDCVLRGGELLDQSLVARRVANVSLIAVASPAYLRAHGTPTHPEQLEREHTMVNHFSTRNGRPYPNEFEKDGQTLEISGRYKLALNESNAVTAAVLAGLGVAQMASFTALPLIERGELVRVLSDWTCMTIPLYVVYPPNRHLSAKVRAFVEWVAELLARHPQMAR
ncbi:MAG: LysR family transcriptional regulator [Burkholderiales bacterium RIFCSPLOWO2_12_67_14]|nr:MAG: LysR family transcriptional regulator [Burkholderiales bacterium RIFCSPLOWO2_02_FULL_67_64]OGB41808.1 MAG: LysR family transcriptional regulator [Burkholderiales bacterium RIFCSPHIGHO2_12_FULL_67_38]OGB48084.1 MAG: LysR family transcriptional regulator [Burkholderiales bacterium RIFCSPLOWO2_12_67_14]OGC01725.1 MAG: LysR family transcriptional regulator [Burkholderiales bacterium RIFCSPLOWO2_12_FULL_67_210]